MSTNLILDKNKQVHFIPNQLVPELRSESMRNIRVENIELEIFQWFYGLQEGNLDPKWVKQLQYRRDWYNLMLLAWNASSSIVKQRL